MITTEPHVVVLDTFNLLHRARTGFVSGDHPVTYQFFRQLRALVELLKPTRIIAPLEGTPKARLELFKEYKANRTVDEAHRMAHEKFMGQAMESIDLLARNFPVSTMHHPDREADDIVATVVMNAVRSVRHTIVSTDTDYIQLLRLDNVELWNPVRKQLVEKPDHDYVTWKALRGDPTDNVPGLPGIGDKTAEMYARDPVLMKRDFERGDLDIEHFARNVDLIELRPIPQEEWSMVTSTSPTRDWDAVRAAFEGWGFRSIFKEATWKKFTETFDPLFG